MAPVQTTSTQVQRIPAMSRQKPNPDDNYEQMVRERMKKYKCSRIVIERGQSAFWSTDDDNADRQLARDAGASTLEEYLQFFADHAHRED